MISEVSGQASHQEYDTLDVVSENQAQSERLRTRGVAGTSNSDQNHR